MNIDINDMNHPLMVLAGFEAFSKQDIRSPDAVYARTVLKLNGCDMMAIAGQEGFVDSLKAGGKKLIEMIKSMLKKIKEFFFGPAGGRKNAQVNKAAEVSGKLTIEIAKSARDTSVLDKARANLDLMNRILEGNAITAKFDDYDQLMENISDINKSETAAYLESQDLLGWIKNVDYKADKVYRDLVAFKLVMDKLDRSGGNGLVELTNITEANKLQDLAIVIRDSASRALNLMTADEEKLVKRLATLEGDQVTDVKTASTITKLQDYIRTMARGIAKLTKLVQDCNSFVLRITDAIWKLADKTVPANTTKPMFDSIEALDKWMMEDGVLTL